MENAKDLQVFINQIQAPAFLIRDGRIVALNLAGAQYACILDKPITELLMIGQEEYASLKDGSLLLTVHLSGIEYCCTVTKLEHADLFVINEPVSQADLQTLSLAAEQLRIPLSELSVTLDTMRHEDPAQKAKLNRSIHQLHRIIGNMSDTVRIQSGVGFPVTCDICALFAEVLEKAATVLAHSGIRLKYNLPDESISAPVDQELLTRGIYNLLSNAAKFSTKNSVIDTTLKRIGKKLYFTVVNPGTTIANELLGSMFTRYARRPGIEDPRHGIGLGMTIIHKAASTHGGTVLVESSHDYGTRITMTIAIRNTKNIPLRSPKIRPDIYGGRDQALVELSDVLPAAAYE